jgi:hypothetical protein
MNDVVHISAAVCICSRHGHVLMRIYAPDSFRRNLYSQIELQSA